MKTKYFIVVILLLIGVFVVSAIPLFASEHSNTEVKQAEKDWWFWPLLLFLATFGMGILAVLGGVGGGVLYVPIVSSFFPFHFDFVRGAGLLVALSSALAGGPAVLKSRFVNLRLHIPIALIASISSIFGAIIGLSVSTQILEIAMGILILAISLLMLSLRGFEQGSGTAGDRLSHIMGIYGIYHEPSSGEDVSWRTTRTIPGFILFILVGLLAGIFGLGAGWANIPVLNIVMGVPLKVAVSTSRFLLSITDTSAAWIYLHNGSVLPIMIVPSIVGIMLGSFIGVRVLRKTKPTLIRWIVIALLALNGVNSILSGFDIY